MGAFGLCGRCAERYCGVPHPMCPICLGTGRVDGGDIEGVDPLVVLRAALMGLDMSVPRARLSEAKLLGDPGSGVIVVTPADIGARSAVGRAAGQLLRDLGLRPAKPRKVLTKEERAARAGERQAKALRAQVFAEHSDRLLQERANERRRRKVEMAAQAAIVAAHLEEFEREREAQEVFVALEEGFGTYMPPAVRRVLDAGPPTA